MVKYGIVLFTKWHHAAPNKKAEDIHHDHFTARILLNVSKNELGLQGTKKRGSETN